MDEAKCVCWRIPDEAGEEHAAAWLFAHDRVRITTTSGKQMEGVSAGPHRLAPCTDPLIRVAWLEVVTGGGIDYGGTREDIASVEPLEGITTKEAAGAAFVKLLEEATEEVTRFHVITADHTTVTIEAYLTERECRPPRLYDLRG